MSSSCALRCLLSHEGGTGEVPLPSPDPSDNLFGISREHPRQDRRRAKVRLICLPCSRSHTHSTLLSAAMRTLWDSTTLITARRPPTAANPPSAIAAVRHRRRPPPLPSAIVAIRHRHRTTALHSGVRRGLVSHVAF